MTGSDFVGQLNRVLRYSMETVENLLTQLHDRPLSRYPQPVGADPATDEHNLFRHIVADSLGDAGRHDEEGLLRDNSQHVIVHNGKAVIGEDNFEGVNQALGRLHDRMRATGHWSHSELHSTLGDRFRPGTVYVEHFADPDAEPVGQQVHITDLPTHLADHYRTLLVDADSETKGLADALRTVPHERVTQPVPAKKGLWQRLSGLWSGSEG